MSELLEIKNLNVRFTGGGRETEVISDLSLSVGHRETLGIVGESGSGKSVTSLAVMRLLSPATSRVKGQILLDGRDLLGLSQREMESVRGNRVAMIVLLFGVSIMVFLISHLVPSNPEAANLSQTALNDPVIVEAYRAKWGLDKPLWEQYGIYMFAGRPS